MPVEKKTSAKTAEPKVEAAEPVREAIKEEPQVQPKPAERNRFMELYTINVNEHVEKKNGLSYLSWAWAWAEFKKHFPDSFYTVYERPDFVNYFTDGRTCWVKTSITLVDGDYRLEQQDQLPVMDFKNKSIPLDQITSMDVNKAIQRSLTKACARHGLGLYIYAGEDLPEEKVEVSELRNDISVELSRVTKNMTPDQAKHLSATVMQPICGGSYRQVDDVKKLQRFLDELKKIA